MVKKPRKLPKVDKSKLIKKLDELTSSIVRKREPYCVTCGTRENLTCSHLITRSKKSIRWDLDNCHTQCRSCNFRHEHYPEIYTEWWLSRYSFEEYQKLIERGNKTKRWTIAELKNLMSYLKEKQNSFSQTKHSGDC